MWVGSLSADGFDEFPFGDGKEIAKEMPKGRLMRGAVGEGE